MKGRTNTKETKYYVICRLDKNPILYYTDKEKWSADIHKAWFFSSKTVHGFNLKDFPSGTVVGKVLIIQTTTIAEPYDNEMRRIQ